MRTRLQVSTDVAAIGIWDPSAATGAAKLETLATQGQALIVRLGADSGGAVDVFVDEELPPAVIAETAPASSDGTVRIQSGELMIDGIEYFNAGARESGAASTCRVPNGTYRATARLTKDEDTLPEPASEAEIRRIVGAAEVEYYDRTNRNGMLIGLSTWLLWPALWFVLPWYVALGVTLVVFVGYFHVAERVLQRNRRYKSIAGKITPLRLAGARPLLVVHLAREG
jgi:hypothetical protein